MSTRLIRRKAVVPLALFVGLLSLAWWLLADPLGRRAVIALGSRMTGAEVDLDAFHIHLFRGSVELDGLQVADASDLSKNLIDAGRIAVDLDPAALFKKKVVIDELALTGGRLGGTRQRPARPIPAAPGDTVSALAQARAFAAKVSVPLLQLTPVDSIRALVLDPSRLKSLAAAAALQARSDSAGKAVQAGYDSLQLQPVLDSTQALLQRVSKLDLRSAGVAGIQSAAKDLNGGLAQVKAAEARVAALKAAAARSASALAEGAKAVDAARLQDYAMARGLLRLPTISAADISAALFGRAAVDRFQQGIYWAGMARRYMPAGMLPRKDPGPRRLRMAGTTVRFPEVGALPTFLLRDAKLGLSFGGMTGSDNVLAAEAKGITSDPALYGSPATFTADGHGSGPHAVSVSLGGILDHTGAVGRDSAGGRIEGLRLPAFALPGLPYGAEPGAGTATFSLAVRGDQLSGRWSVEAPSVTWTRGAGGSGGAMDELAGKLLRGIGTLTLDARLSGTLGAPQISVSSNVGDALAKGVSAMLGQQVSAAEAKARAQVDQQVAGAAAAAKARAADVAQRAATLANDAEARLQDEQRQLDAKLKSLTAGALPGGIHF
jgi:uncharacterized protein (TIGR03545 family)